MSETLTIDPPATEPLPLPPLREDLQLLEGPAAVGGAPTWTVHDPVRNRYFRLDRVAFELLARWGAGEGEALLARVAAETTLSPRRAQLEGLVEFLRRNNLLRGDAAGMTQYYAAQAKAGRSGRLTWLIHNYLFMRLPLVRPDRFLGRTLPLVAPLYRPAFQRLLLIVGLLGIYLAGRQWDEFVTTFGDLFDWQALAGFAVTLFLLKVLHELGHAYTAKRYGCRVPTMGVALLVLWPVLYTDATDAWRLPSRRQRLAIGAAGIVVELAVALVATFVWSFLPDGTARGIVFFIAMTSWVTTLAINLNPFMRFDGYYLLSDLLGVENLQERAFAFGRWRLRRLLFGLDDPPPEPMAPARRRVLTLFAWGTWVYRFFLFIGIALLVYHFFFKLLGLVLFAVEIVWFIGLPLWRETAAWWGMRGRMEMNRNLVTSGLLAAGALAAALVPWSGALELPAVLRAREYTVLYPPAPSRLVAMTAEEGAVVAAGRPLFELEAPELDHELAQVERRIALLERRIGRRAASSEEREVIRVLEQELAEQRAARSGLRERRAELVVRAPFDGRVVDLARALHVGRWLGEEQPLARMVAPGGGELVAYVAGEARPRVTEGAAARFYPEDPARPPLEAVVRTVERVNVATLEQPYLASTYGGALAVREDGEGRKRPEASLYRVRLDPVEGSGAVDQVVRGTARVEGEARSLFGRAWRAVAAVVIRESGF